MSAIQLASTPCALAAPPLSRKKESASLQTPAANHTLEVFKNKTAAAALAAAENPTTAGDYRKRMLGGLAGWAVAMLGNTTGPLTALHEIIGHGFLGLRLTENYSSGQGPTYQNVGFDHFEQMIHSGSFKEGIVNFFRWITAFDSANSPSGACFPGNPDGPSGIGHIMGADGRSAWVSIAGSIPGLALDTLSVIGGMGLRKRHPALGNAMVAFGLTDCVFSSSYAIQPTMMSTAEMKSAAATGHDFANFDLKISDMTGIAPGDVAIATAVVWTSIVPLAALFAYLHFKSNASEAVPDMLAVKRWLQKAEANPEMAARLEGIMRSYPQKKFLSEMAQRLQIADQKPLEPIAKLPDPAKSPFSGHLRPRSSTNPLGVGLVARTVAARLPLTNGRKIIGFSGAGSFATGSLTSSAIETIQTETLRLAEFLLDRIPTKELKECKKEILAEWDKNAPVDRLQTVLSLASLAGTVSATAAKVLSFLSSASSGLQTAATVLTWTAPVFILASVASAAYQVYKDIKCPDWILPKNAKMLSAARLVVSVATSTILITSLFVPGLNAACFGALLLGGSAAILLSYMRTRTVQKQIMRQKAMEPETWNVMNALWIEHQKKPAGTAMSPALKRWIDCVRPMQKKPIPMHPQVKMRGATGARLASPWISR